MRRIINSTYITLDGVIANPQTWPSGRVADEAGVAIQTDLLRSCDAILMGRQTYESFAAAWPTRSGDPFSDQINSMAKYVVSSTLERADWRNSTIISGKSRSTDRAPEARTGEGHRAIRLRPAVLRAHASSPPGRVAAVGASIFLWRRWTGCAPLS
jgi:dihydrofolate reductase